MDVLADQRRASTVSAVIAIGLQSADAATQQEALELLDVMGDGRRHDRSRISPPHARFLLVYGGVTRGKAQMPPGNIAAVNSAGRSLLSELATVAYIDSIVMI